MLVFKPERQQLQHQALKAGVSWIMAPESSEPCTTVEPDWKREEKKFFEWLPSRSLLASIRAYQQHRKDKGLLASTLKKFAVLRHRFWSIVTGADIPLNCNIGGGLLIPHPNGIVIHPGAKVGVNCLILQQVTIGVLDENGPPSLGDHVDCGAGSKILGRIVIGSNVLIGANAVVIQDIGSGSTAVGIPAKVIKFRQPFE